MSDEVVLPAAGWYTDPSDESRIRYWDGATWTDHVATSQVVADSQSVSSNESESIDQVEPEVAAPSTVLNPLPRTPREATVAMFFAAAFVITALVAVVALITSN
jgi:hypothetical protein